MQAALDSIASTCSSDRAYSDSALRIFRSQQRALGELMIDDDGHDAEGRTRTDCMGFAAFSARLAQSDDPIQAWFKPLVQGVERLAVGPASNARVRAFQHSLLNLLVVVDPQFERFPAPQRTPAPD